MSDENLPRRSQLVLEQVARAGIQTVVRRLPESSRTAAQAAAALGCEVGAIASSLLFLADEAPLLVMTSGAHRVDPDLLARAVGADRLTMARAEQVREVTGQVIGGVAPTGHPEPIRTVVDESLAGHQQIWTAAGTDHTVMPLTFADLITLTDGVPVSVAAD